MVGKRAKEEFLPEFESLAERLKRLEGRVEGVGTIIDKTQVTNVYTGLAESVPEWRDINQSEQFKRGCNSRTSIPGGVVTICCRRRSLDTKPEGSYRFFGDF